MSIIPAPYRWLALIVFALALLAFGFTQGAEYEEGQQAKRDLAAERATVVLATKRADVTSKVELKYAPQLTKVRTVTKTLIKEVPVYVSANDCPMSPGFRLHHDAAAQGVLPDATGIADAAAVPAPDVASTTAENYGTCLENAKRLEGLQEWVRNQEAVK